MSGSWSAASAAEAGERLTGGAQAIAESVLFASLFDYPVTLTQLRQTLVESDQTATEILNAFEHSSALRAVVESSDGFYFPHGRHDLIAERRRREARSRIFLERHGPLLRAICAVPYVEMVSLSGSIAHLNLESGGDLDLFIVTRGRHVWSVTVAVIVLAKLMRRRKTLCANFVVANTALALDDQDLFTASQIIHLKPLIGTGTYRRFLAANPFVARFYPNFHGAPSRAHVLGQGRVIRATKSALETLLAWPAAAAEGVCRRAYRGYLKRRAVTWQSPDQVRLDDDRLKLHTHSHRASVLRKLNLLSAQARAVREP